MIGRIRVHAAKQNWFAVAIDLVIVVVGVFLGLQANNWNQDRIDRSEAREFRGHIIENLRANEADLAARTFYFQQVRAHAVAALASVTQPDTSVGESFLVDAYQASQVWRRPFERTAYDDLQASGVARKIGDARTRAELSGYYVGAQGFDATATGVTSYRETLRRTMDLKVQERIRANCDDIVRNLPGGGQAPVLPQTCRPGLDPAIVTKTVETLKAVPGLDRDLTRLIIDIDQKLALFARTSRNATNLRRQLETG